MHRITEWVRTELRENAEQEYREFHKSLVPGLENMLGVRIPKLREIAKKPQKKGTGSLLKRRIWMFMRK